ncbi:MAG TPA: NAD-binding protein [Sandaracinaceae bacterium LLY-WYZ-13_1]|nr:NAD-binding protein [Sandaracinaceae bacterium LLY-WYZ-13_1]
MRLSRAAWLLRGGLLVLAFSLALVALRAGVGVTDRAGVEGADLLTHVYYSLGLFVLGGLDLGLPQGGPAGARAMLWIAYFLAPLITTSAVLEGAIRLLSPRWLQRRALRGHVVLVGIGRLGLIYLETLRAREPRRQVLVVDADGQRANVEIASERLGAKFLAGDIRNAATLDALAMHRAHAVVLLTDDDLVNLEAGWRIAERTPGLPVVAHVGDIGMRRTVARVDAGEAPRVHVFNSHRIAAERLYQEHLEEHFAATSPQDVLVLAGFGRFGQTILEYLQREAGGEIQRVILVDVAAERQVRLFRAQVPGFEEVELVTVQGDLDDPEVWEEVERAASGYGVEPVFVLGTDDDQLNLRTAIALRSLHGDDTRIFVRCVYESRFTSQLSDQLDFEVLAVEAMLREALDEQQRSWLEV